MQETLTRLLGMLNDNEMEKLGVPLITAANEQQYMFVPIVLEQLLLNACINVGVDNNTTEELLHEFNRQVDAQLAQNKKELDEVVVQELRRYLLYVEGLDIK